MPGLWQLERDIEDWEDYRASYMRSKGEGPTLSGCQRMPMPSWKAPIRATLTEARITAALQTPKAKHRLSFWIHRMHRVVEMKER